MSLGVSPFDKIHHGVRGEGLLRPTTSPDLEKRPDKKKDHFLRQIGALGFLGAQVFLFYFAPRWWGGKVGWLNRFKNEKPMDVISNIAICFGLELLVNQSTLGDEGKRKWVFWPSTHWDRIPATISSWDLLPATIYSMDGFTSSIVPVFVNRCRQNPVYQRLVTAGGRTRSFHYRFGDPTGQLRPGSIGARIFDQLASWITRIPKESLTAGRETLWKRSFLGSSGRFGAYLGEMVVMNTFFSLLWLPALSLYILSQDAPAEDKLDYGLKSFIGNLTFGSVRRSILWRIFPKEKFPTGQYYAATHVGHGLVQGVIMLVSGSRRGS